MAKITLNLCTKSPSLRGAKIHAGSLTLAAADQHPEEVDEFEHHFRAGFAPPDAAFRCCKKRQGRHTRSAPFIRCVELRWRLKLPQLLPQLPSYARAPALASSCTASALRSGAPQHQSSPSLTSGSCGGEKERRRREGEKEESQAEGDVWSLKASLKFEGVFLERGSVIRLTGV